MKLAKFITALMVLMFANLTNSIANDVVIETARGFSFSMHDFKSDGYAYPSFKFNVRMPDGSIIGWDESEEKWTGTVTESRVRTQPFNYPWPSQECTSKEEYVEVDFSLSPEIEGGYSINNELYCRNIINGKNSFISSGYAFGLTGATDGKYELTITSDKYAIIDFCYSYGVDNLEPINILCTYDKLKKNMLIVPNSEQIIEISYNYTNPAENKIEKVITPLLLIDEWDGCYQLGFIKNRGIFNSINKKLLAAEKKYEAGNINAAQNINNAVINEINAQYGKGIDAQCADILIEDLRYTED